MERFSYMLTIFFVLIGPVKIIPGFAELTRGRERDVSRRLAYQGELIAVGMCLVIVALGNLMVARFHITLDALRISAGIVLIVAALKVMFAPARPPGEPRKHRSLIQIAISPLATPIIVPPAGVAAVLIIATLLPQNPHMVAPFVLALVIILVLDFLVMFFNRQILRVPGLLLALEVLAAVLVFVQVALGIETILRSLASLGVVELPQ